jgi:hypothetical protein
MVTSYETISVLDITQKLFGLIFVDTTNNTTSVNGCYWTALEAKCDRLF